MLEKVSESFRFKNCIYPLDFRFYVLYNRILHL